MLIPNTSVYRGVYFQLLLLYLQVDTRPRWMTDNDTRFRVPLISPDALTCGDISATPLVVDTDLYGHIIALALPSLVKIEFRFHRCGYSAVSTIQ